VWTGRALALGVAGSLSPLEPGEPLPLDQLERLPYAPGYAEELLDVLQQFDYAAQVGQGGKSDDLASSGRVLSNSVEEVIEQSRQEAASAVIVHVLSHGSVTNDHLYVYGNDGSRGHNHVETWLGWVQDHDGIRPHALFILDICHSGKATRRPWLEFTPAATRRAWVIAACLDEEKAFNGRFTRALIDVLQKYGSLDLRVDPKYAYIPLGTFVKEIDRELDRDRDGDRCSGLPQHIEMSHVQPLELDTILTNLPFFKNKNRNPLSRARTELSSRLPEMARAMLDAVPDAEYFLDRAGGGNPPGGEQEVGFFQGRQGQLRELAAWMNGTGGPLKVVTGKPGVGKSALLGILVCTTHPKLRDATQRLWGHLPYPPPVLVDRFCALHARLRTLPEITEGLARQLGLGSIDNAERLAAEIAGLDGVVPVILVDAVDEARDPEGLANVLLLQLATASRADGGPACRLLIGSRSGLWIDALIRAAGSEQATSLDLGLADPGELRTALIDYLNRVLRMRGPYATAALDEVREHLAVSVAEILTGRDGGVGTPDWGEFLVAVVFAHHLLASEPARSFEEAEQLAASVPRDLPGVLRLDQSRQASPWMRPILAAVARAHGEGMPEPLIELAVPVMRPKDQQGVAPTSREVHEVLDQAEFYLRRSVDTDGYTLYRLFHQSLTDWLRQEPWESADGNDAAPEVAGPLFEALTGQIVGRGRPGTWRSARPYLVRHGSEHAVEAGRLDDLLVDPEFLVHADPDILARHLHHATSAAARQAAAIHRASYVQHHQATPQVRREILAVDAARFGQLVWAQDLAGMSRWQLRWATGGQVSSALLATLAGHVDGARAVTTTVTAGRPTAVTADGDGSVRVWDLLSGEVAATLGAHSGWINGVACHSSSRALLLVTANEDRAARVWDLTTAQVKVTLRGHGDSVSAVATAATGHGREVVLTVSGDDTARVWDLDTGQVLLEFSEHTNAVTGIACSVVDGRPVAVTTSNDRTAQVWDIETGRVIATYSHPAPLRGVACTGLSGRPVAVTVSEDGTVQVWDIETGRVIATYSHPAPLRGVACTDLSGRPVAVTVSEDGTAQVWDIESGQELAVLAGHTGPVIAAACAELYGLPVAITTSTDGTARVWDLTPDRKAPALPAPHTGPIRALTCVTAGTQPTVVSGSADGAIRLWDLATGRQLASLPGSGPVNSVDATEIQGRLVVTGTRDDQTGHIWEPADQARPIPLNGFTDAVTTGTCVARDGTPVLVTTSGPWLHVWDLSVAAPGVAMTSDTTVLTGHSGPVNAAARTELDGRPMVVTVSNEPVVRIFDPVTGKVAGLFSRHVGRVLAVACGTLHGRPIAVTGGDDWAIVWDLANQDVLATLDGHPGPVTAVTCTIADDEMTAFTASGNSVRAWDAATGQLLGTFHFPYSVHALCGGWSKEIVVATGRELVAMTLSDHDPAKAVLSG
jgi:WD40 repeat protein